MDQNQTTSPPEAEFKTACGGKIAWKTAGWIGLDRWLLVQVGAPWQPGLLLQRK